MKIKNVIGIGNALVDIMTQLDNDVVLENFGLPKGSMTLVDRDLSEKIQGSTKELEIKLTTGGSVANATAGIAKLGVPSAFVGSVSDDEMGAFFSEEQKKNGIEPRVKVVEGRTGRAVALVSADGERTFATYLGASLEMKPEDLNAELFSGYDMLFIEGYLVQDHDLIRKAAQVAKAAGMKIAIDMASFNVVEQNHDIFTELVENYVDVLFANEEEAAAYSKQDDPKVALAQFAKTVEISVVKVGAEGAFIQRGEEVVHVPTLGKKVVDTTGAGDSFAAGFLAGLAKGYDLEKCGKLGSLLASYVIAKMGALVDESSWSTILEQEKEL